MTNNTTQNSYGLKKFGFIGNFSAQLMQINHLLIGTGKTFKMHDVDALVDSLATTNLNSYGCNNFHGAPIDDGHASYKIINTGVKTASGEDIIGLFIKNRKRGSFEGVTWTTSRGLRMELALIGKPHMGEIYFASKEASDSFLEGIARNAIPEPWGFCGKTSSCKYPILKSYLENIFGRLRKEAADGKENKVVYSTDRQHILFNTNLPDTFGNDIFILAEVRKKPNGEEYFENPSMFKSGIQGRRQYKFQDEVKPEPATFFEDVNEVIFQSNWEIDANFEHLEHIIKDNRDRFPKEYQVKEPVEIARNLKEAIAFATTLAKRNFKYIAPMYRPQINRIQLLMPIYLSGSYKKAPDFALVLTPENGIYVPETILPIAGAYQNARLIAMPDEAWLRPETIFKSESEA